jgi:hypothetical protein
MDPHRVLGVPPTATPEELAATYRLLAKEWHPDRGGGAAAEARMAEINAAYDILRATAWTQRHENHAAPVPEARTAGRGAWLPPAIRGALGHELLGVVEPGESIWLVTPATTWASPQALLAASDRRLLWLLDDAPIHRVRSLRFHDVAHAERRLAWPRRRRAELRVRTTGGRRHAFAELRPAVADAIARRVAEAATP